MLNWNKSLEDGSAWTTGPCDRRIDRGGSWSKLDSMTRFAFRDVFAPFPRSDGVGFRVALIQKQNARRFPGGRLAAK